MIILIGLSKNILPAHFYGDYKLDSNFLSCILSKFSNFCAQINNALTFNSQENHNNNTHWPKQEHLTCILLWVILIEFGALLIPQPELRSPTRKDYKSKTSSPPNSISSSHVSSSLNLYQLDPHTALSSSLRIS